MKVKKKRKGGKKKGKKRNFFTWKYLILTILSISIVLFYVWERVGILKDGYKIRKMTKRKNELSEEKGLLRGGIPQGSAAVRENSPGRVGVNCSDQREINSPHCYKSAVRTNLQFKISNLQFTIMSEAS